MNTVTQLITTVLRVWASCAAAVITLRSANVVPTGDDRYYRYVANACFRPIRDIDVGLEPEAVFNLKAEQTISLIARLA